MSTGPNGHLGNERILVLFENTKVFENIKMFNNINTIMIIPKLLHCVQFLEISCFQFSSIFHHLTLKVLKGENFLSCLLVSPFNSSSVKILGVPF